jgi:hypothetical protein
MLVMSFGQVLAFGDRDDVMGRMRGNRVAAVPPSEPARKAIANHAIEAVSIRSDNPPVAANAS